MDIVAYRAALRGLLRDSGLSVWSDGQLDDAPRQALEQYSRVAPLSQVAALTLASGGREQSVAGLGGLLEVAEVWLPYTAAQPETPPQRRAFRRLTPTTLYLEDGAEPDAGETMRVFYTALHTVQGLDGAGTTTIPAWHAHDVAAGAAALAAQARARQVAEAENALPAVRRWTVEWAAARTRDWEAWLGEVAAPMSGWVGWPTPPAAAMEF